MKSKADCVRPRRIILSARRRRGAFRWYLTPHTLLLLSSLLYFIPYLVGSFKYILPNGRVVEVVYSSEVGLAVGMIIIMLVFCAAKLGKQGGSIVNPRRESSIESKVLAAVIMASGIYVLLSGKADIANKQEMLDQTGRLDFAFYLSCSLGLIFSSIVGYKKHFALFCLSLCGLAFIMYLGHRSSLIIALIGIAYARFRDNPVPRIPLKYATLAAGLLFLVSVYKSVYVAIKIGRWDLVSERLDPQNIFSSAMVGMEQFTTFAHLDFVVADNFRLACSNAWLIPFTIVPFSENVLSAFWDVEACYYNAQVQPIFFSGYSGGVAANIWAEFFGYFGYVGFPVLIAVLSIFYWIIEKAIQRTRSPVMVAGLIVALINMSFYIQRKELLGAFISGKRAFLVALAVFLIAAILRIANKRITRVGR